MPVSPGTHLGPYEILSPLGTGGMGKVYRARDSKLKRDVAVKVLSIFDFGTQDGTTYAVMELLEGDTLRG